MKIILPTIGTHGDVQPYRCLGAAIRAEPDGVTEAVRLIEELIERKESTS